jgi:DNA-binding response OmpR family regulator
MPTGIPRPLKILVADDDEVFNRTMELRLQDAAFLMESVLDGKSALQKLEKEHFDLLILDLMMPGMTGFDVLRTMRDKDIKTRVIVLSLWDQPEDMRLAKELGASECFSKASPSFIEDVVKYAQNLSIS